MTLVKMPEKTREHYFLEFSRSNSSFLRWGIFLCAGVLGGVAGLLSILLAQGLLKLGGAESAEKHGISNRLASRLGGVVIAGFVAFSLFWHEFMDTFSIINHQVAGVLILSSCYFALGLFEDLKGILKAKLRFVAMLVITVIFLMYRPDFILRYTGLGLVDEFVLASLPFAFVFTVVGLVFFVNAFNTADGANGLVSGITIFTVIGLIQLGIPGIGPFWASVGIGCGIFWLFNVSVGRIFMGDGGAYFLGATLGLGLLLVCNEANVSVWYLLCLVFYPHADLLFSMLRRKVSGKSLFGADNGHLHNLLYKKLSTINVVSNHANTVTGLLISIVFAGFPLLINLLYGDEVNFLVVYCLMWVCYSMIWSFLVNRKFRDISFN